MHWIPATSWSLVIWLDPDWRVFVLNLFELSDWTKSGYLSSCNILQNSRMTSGGVKYPPAPLAFLFVSFTTVSRKRIGNNRKRAILIPDQFFTARGANDTQP